MIYLTNVSSSKLHRFVSRFDLLCWLDIEAFKRLPHQAIEKRDEKAKEIKSKYLHKKYFFGPSSPATKDEQNQVQMFITAMWIFLSMLFLSKIMVFKLHICFCSLESTFFAKRYVASRKTAQYCLFLNTCEMYQVTCCLFASGLLNCPVISLFFQTDSRQAVDKCFS